MQENIIISNKADLEKKKQSIIKEGKDKLHILIDFDRTFIKEFVDGERIPSMISILRDGSYLTPDYAEKAHALFNKYHPIEINSKIPLKEKKKAMQEWWKTHFDLLIKYRLNKKDVEKVVKSEKIRLREGASEFIDLLHKYNIPLVIMSSSGLGDGISLYLKNKGKLYSNIHIISNSFEWDKEGRAIKIKEPIIHSMNKAEIVVKDYPVFKLIKNRKNVLLLGNTLEDVDMVKGFDYKTLIKIGFLNKDVDQNLKAYKKVYDIILLNDTDMDDVNDLLKEILK